MKLDMDLVRKILFKLEEYPHGFYKQMLQIEGYSAEQIGYHVTIMAEAGLLLAIDATSMDSISPEAIPQRLTWQGHEFLEAARDEERWGRAKAIVTELKGATLDSLKMVLSQLIQAELAGMMG